MSCFCQVGEIKVPHLDSVDTQGGNEWSSLLGQVTVLLPHMVFIEGTCGWRGQSLLPKGV
jgi:hypothetical protein